MWKCKNDGCLERKSMNFAKMTQKKFKVANANMSCRNRKQYYVSLCADPPPKVLNVRQSRERMKYRHRMAYKRRKGDKMLNTKYFTKADTALGSATDVDHMLNTGRKRHNR